MRPPSFHRGVFLLIDGARADVVEQLLQAGELPNLKRWVVDRGSYRTAVTVFPSTTGPAHVPFLTGCTPGTCNIPGIRWFDPMPAGRMTHFSQCRSYVGPGSLRMDSDLYEKTRTVFEFFKRPVGVFSVVNRGIPSGRRRAMAAKCWHWLYGHYSGRWDAVDAAAWRHAHRAVERDADFLFAVLPAVDELAHLTHPFSEPVLEAYRAIDRSFGDLVNHLARKRVLDETLFIVSSDHGLTATHTHFELFSFLEQQGHRTLYYPRIFKNNASAVSMISGNAMAHVYLRNGHDWYNPHEADMNLIAACIEQEAVDLAVSRHGPGTLHVYSRSGAAEIRDEGETVVYRKTSSDPFGYPELPYRMTHDQSLERTYDSMYPDALFQLTRLFRSARSGDLVISARKGYDLRRLFENPEHHASHGSLHREHMRVPLLINHPIHRPFVRTVDVFPSMLELLGHSAPEGIEGRSFVDSESGRS